MIWHVVSHGTHHCARWCLIDGEGDRMVRWHWRGFGAIRINAADWTRFLRNEVGCVLLSVCSLRE
jgi:hypothetical protein